MTIDKSVRRWQFKNHHCFERQIAQKSFNNEQTEEIKYPDLDNKERVIKIDVTNDGLSKTITFSLLGESVRKENKLLNTDKNPADKSTLQRSTIRLELSLLSISIIGYTR